MFATERQIKFSPPGDPRFKLRLSTPRELFKSTPFTNLIPLFPNTSSTNLLFIQNNVNIRQSIA